MPRKATELSASAAIVVAAVGVAVFCGWAFDLHALKSIYGPITMKTNPAIAFACCGVSLWLRARDRAAGLAAATAGLAALIGALTLSQHLFGWDLGVDQLLFIEAPGAAATASPNRMGPHASTSLLLAGIALVVLRRDAERPVRLAQTLSFTGAAFAIVAITGYVYGAVELYGIARYTGIALHTALTLLVLHAGILAVRADRGPMAIFVDEGAAGTLLRRLTLPVVALPLLLGYLFIVGRGAELFDRGLGASLFAVATIVILLVTLWRTAAAIQASDLARRRAHDEAERANRLKDQFLAVLSHELRTPLNVMLGRLRLLEREADPNARVRAATVIARNGQLLARLVGDLLDWSRAAAGQFEISPARVDLNALVQTAIDAMSSEAAKRNVRLAADLGAGVGTLNADPHRLLQVLGNILSNAVKFTPAGGVVTVRTARSRDTAIVTVSDTGVGFAGEFEPQLFEPFRQADQSAAREHGGLGLGLSIARHLVTLHGGTIHASSAGIGHGATFTIELPAPPMPAPAGHAAGAKRDLAVS